SGLLRRGSIYRTRFFVLGAAQETGARNGRDESRPYSGIVFRRDSFVGVRFIEPGFVLGAMQETDAMNRAPKATRHLKYGRSGANSTACASERHAGGASLPSTTMPAT